MQLLDQAGLKDQMDLVWQFFKGSMVKVIAKYQVEESTCQTASYVEHVLCEAVKNEPAKKANFYIMHKLL